MKGLAKDIFKFLQEKNTILTNLKCALTDGTRKMTGWRHGAISELEELLSHPLQRLICFNHHVELPFNKLFVFYDGDTTGPSTFEGPIGKSIQEEVWQLPIREFSKIENPILLSRIENMSVEVFQSLSEGHQHFINIIQGILKGEINKQWSEMKIGKVVHSRWTTGQTRICRLYMSTEEPTYQMQRIVNFIIMVYAPVFLATKHFNLAEEGPNEGLMK